MWNSMKVNQSADFIVETKREKRKSLRKKEAFRKFKTFLSDEKENPTHCAVR